MAPPPILVHSIHRYFSIICSEIVFVMDHVQIWLRQRSQRLITVPTQHHTGRDNEYMLAERHLRSWCGGLSLYANDATRSEVFHIQIQSESQRNVDMLNVAWTIFSPCCARCRSNCIMGSSCQWTSHQNALLVHWLFAAWLLALLE